MRAHRDILSQEDSLRHPFFHSLTAHAAALGAMALYSMIGPVVRDRWGDPHSLGGGSVAITPVSRIPLAAGSGAVNPVANDTESRVPAPPKPEAVKRPKMDEPESIPIRGRAKDAKKKAQVASAQKYRKEEWDRSNQLYSGSGARASSPLYGSPTAGGGVGLGAGSPFGNRFGYYEQLLRERVARAWRTQDVDSRLQTAPPVIITFEIARNGSVRNVRLLQRSGNTHLDYSCQRAILEASPFPPLPAGFERDLANIEFWFQLRR